MKVFTSISLMLTCSACQNDNEELPYDIFDDFEAQLFTVTEYFAHPVSEVTTTIFFEKNFDLADYPDITHFKVYYDTPDSPDMKSIYNIDRTNYF